MKVVFREELAVREQQNDEADRERERGRYVRAGLLLDDQERQDADADVDPAHQAGRDQTVQGARRARLAFLYGMMKGRFRVDVRGGLFVRRDLECVRLFGHAIRAVQAVGPAAAALLLLTPPAASAQETPDSARFVLDSLVVEALRLPMAAREAPFALSVVSAADAREARPGRGLAETLRTVPGVQVSDRNNDALGERIVIRGAGARAGFGVRGVRVLIDGIPATLPDGQTDLSRLDMATVGRIEVLRGPAAALYGNASGGVVRISSAPPSLDPVGVEGEAMTGDDGLLRLHGRVSGQPGLAWYDASVTHREMDGFREYNTSTRSFARASGGFPLASGHLALHLSANRYDADNPGSLSAATMAVDRTQAHPTNVTQRAGEEAEQALAGITWTGAIGPGVLELRGYGSARTLENPIPVSIIEVDRRVGGVSAAWGMSWLVGGVELDAQRDDRLNFDNVEGERGDLTLDQLERVGSLGAFAQARASLRDWLGASAAVRYDRFRFEVEDRLIDGDPDDSGERTMDAFSPSVGLHARLAERFDVFANLSTSFETPTTTELANRPSGAGGFNPDLQPQRTLSYEAGVRGYATAALRFELTAWQARTRDALIPFEVPDAPGRQFFRNAGSTRSHGIEAALQGTAPLRIEWDLAYAWIDSRFDDFTVDDEMFDDNDVPGIAPHRFAGSLTRRTQSWLVGLEMTHTGAVPVDDANVADADGWTTIDLRGQLRVLEHAGGLWLFAGATNLLDEEYVGSVVVNAFGGRFYEPAPGRGFYLGLRAGGR